MAVKILQPDPYMVIEVGSGVELRVRPYTADRLHVQVTRYENAEYENGKRIAGESYIVTYFDVSLDDLRAIHKVGATMIRAKIKEMTQ